MHQDQPIVLDDVDALYRDANGIRLLKQLCQSEPSRLLGWYSDPQYMQRRGGPPKFTTSSPVAIIAKANPAFKTEAERVKAFREGGGGSRATYFNYAKKIHPLTDGNTALPQS